MLKRRPGRSGIQLTPLEKKKPLGINPKIRTPKRIATDKPTKHFKEIWL
jgi:hypothetical protein